MKNGRKWLAGVLALAMVVTTLVPGLGSFSASAGQAPNVIKIIERRSRVTCLIIKKCIKMTSYLVFSVTQIDRCFHLSNLVV